MTQTESEVTRTAPASDPATSPRAPGGAAARTRLLALAAVVASAAVIAVSAWLRPDPHGYGTHQQFGAKPCGMLILTGYPCPTCGMTTAFAHAVRGQWWRAFLAQPAGFVLALATLATGVVACVALVRGRWPRWPFAAPPAFHLFLTMFVLLIGGWAFKIALGLALRTLPYR